MPTIWNANCEESSGGAPQKKIRIGEQHLSKIYQYLHQFRCFIFLGKEKLYSSKIVCESGDFSWERVFFTVSLGSLL